MYPRHVTMRTIESVIISSHTLNTSSLSGIKTHTAHMVLKYNGSSLNIGLV